MKNSLYKRLFSGIMPQRLIIRTCTSEAVLNERVDKMKFGAIGRPYEQRVEKKVFAYLPKRISGAFEPEIYA